MAGHKYAIVLCVDKTYLPFALFMAEQIHRLEPQGNFDLCLITDEAAAIPDSLSHLNIRNVQALTDPTYETLKTTHLPRSAYLRMWAAQILVSEYDRILYLDADMFVEGAGFSTLFDLDLQGCAIGAVRDVQQWYRPKRVVHEYRQPGQDAKRYFNSGFLLIDTQRFVAANILEKALEIEKLHPDLVRHHDQSLLNLAVQGDWIELSPIWNWQWPIKYPLFGDWIDIRVHHFIGLVKPWNDPDHKAPRRFQLAYAAFFKAHFPELPAPKPPEFDVLRSGRRMSWLFLRFTFLRWHLLRYLKRFPTPFTVYRNR